MPPVQPEATVIVPTRNRPRALARCLAALAAQASPPETEVIVVDDGSADAAGVARVVATSERARLIRLEGEGPAAARNRGARAARGSLLLFTDDDCEPAPDWLAILTDRLRGGARVAAGSTVNGERDNALAEASQTIARVLMESSLPPAPGPPFAPSNNLACTAAVLAATPFDQRFPSAGGEDRDWCARLAASGVSLVPEPAAVVIHRHELDLGGFWRQHVVYGRGAHRFRTASATGGWSEPPRFYARLLRAGFARGPAVGAAVLLAQVATATGFLREAASGRLRARRLFDAVGVTATVHDARARLRYLADRDTRARNARFAASMAPGEPPLPPPRLVYAVAGHFDLDEYWESGEVHAELIRDVLARNGRAIEHCRAVLDFGCGCGRVLRHWRGVRGTELHGCDRDERAIAWCRRALGFAAFRVNGLAPPLPYADGAFDLVYAVSVFTHLTEELQHAWMRELERVLAPGGILLITTKGRTRLGPLDDDERGHFDAGELVVQAPRYAGRNLCAAYHPERYVRDRLAGAMRVLDFRPAPNGTAPNVFGQSQDVFLLERP